MKYDVLFHIIGKDKFYRVWHQNEHDILIFFHTDGGSIVFGRECLPIKKGTLCFIPAKTFHYTAPSNPSTYERTKLTISPEMLCEIERCSHSLREEKTPSLMLRRVIYAEAPAEYYNEICDLFSDLRDDGESGLFVLSRIAEIFSLLIKFSKNEFPTGLDSFSECILYINEHLSERLTLTKIAEHAGLDNSYFCRLFKRKIGMSPMAYVQKTRIAHAKEMLLNTNRNITEIAELTGFSSVSLFCQTFKADTGITAFAYRNRYKGINSKVSNI